MEKQLLYPMAEERKIEIIEQKAALELHCCLLFTTVPSIKVDITTRNEKFLRYYAGIDKAASLESAIERRKSKG